MSTMRAYEYETASWSDSNTLDGSRRQSFQEWLNDRGAEGWHLSAMTERPETTMLRRSFFCVFARRVEIKEK